MNIKSIILALGIVGFIASCNSPKQGNTTGKTEDFVVGFYNVENLFDTINNPDTHDDEFTPDGRKEWTSKRYNDKINKLSKVIASINGEDSPWAMGLCEIENKTVVEDLIANQALNKHAYKIVHFDSPDERGIDVAFIYRNDKLEVLKAEAIATPFAFDTLDKTRDILYVHTKFTGSKTEAHFFINHWPSRSGGMEKSEPKRMAVANFLKERTDDILQKDANAHIICMGDFNDEPANNSIVKALGCKPPQMENITTGLYNLAYVNFNEGLGSYHYWRENKWNMLDQAIVSGQLLKGDKGLQLADPDMQIFKEDWILFTNEDGTKVPNKTYGKNYFGGYSDHLPVYVKLRLNK